MLNPNPATTYLKDYTPPAFLISSVDLDVDLRDDHALVKARLAVMRNAAADRGAPLELDGDEMELVSVCRRRQGPGAEAITVWIPPA